MSSRTDTFVFWAGGVLWAVLLSVLVVDSHREVVADVVIVGRMDSTVADGRSGYERHHCAACHAVFGIGAGFAPDLTRASQRLGDSAIRDRLASGTFHEGVRKMPSKPLEPREIEGIVRYLAWVARADARERPRAFTPERVAAALRRAAPSPEPGAALVAVNGCLDCHAIGERGSHRGPRLEEIAARDEAAFVGEYLARPARFAPGTSMPTFSSVPEAERHAMGVFVAGLAR